MVMAGEKTNVPAPRPCRNSVKTPRLLAWHGAAPAANVQEDTRVLFRHRAQTPAPDVCARSAAKTTPRASFLSKHFSSVRLRSSGNLQLVPDDAPPPTPTKTA